MLSVHAFPTSTRAPHRLVEPLPIPRLTSVKHDSDEHIAVSTLNARGRIAARRIVSGTLGWRANQEVGYSVNGQMILASTDSSRQTHGVVSDRGHLRLPAAFLRAVGLRPSDQVLLVAEPASNLLAIVPSTMLIHLLRPALYGEHALR